MIDYDTTLLLTAVILAVPYSAALSEGVFFFIDKNCSTTGNGVGCYRSICNANTAMVRDICNVTSSSCILYAQTASYVNVRHGIAPIPTE